MAWKNHKYSYSHVLARRAKSDPRIAEYEFDPGNDAGVHWLHLEYPWETDDGGSVHESTVKECLETLKYIRRGKG